MNRPGDWNCRSCNHLNFQRRDSCQRCGEPRPGDHYGSFGGGRGGSLSFGGSGFSSGPDVRPGDWYCSLGNCGAHNFANRSSCFKCGAYKDESGGGGHAFGGGGGGGGPFDAFDGMRGSRGYGFATGGGGGGGSSRSSWKSGDWICSRPGCSEHNFASRMECYRCSAPRDSSGRAPF